jgi:ABC-2 type transport system permease protein
MISKRIQRLYQYRRFILSLVKANLKLRYRASLLGWLWTLINPLLILAVFTLIFTKILSGMPVKKFPAFMMAAYLPWTFTLAALINATYCLTSNASLMQMIRLPRESFPIAEVLAQAVSFFLTLPVLILGMYWFQVEPTRYLLWFPWVFFCQFVLTLGLSIFASWLYLYFRDLKHLLEVGLTLLFYATPIFYPLTLVPERFQIIYQLNPFTALSVSWQDLIIFGRTPSLFHLSYPLLLGIVILYWSYQQFILREGDFAEKI